jgi:hypothetical protein
MNVGNRAAIACRPDNVRPRYIHIKTRRWRKDIFDGKNS